MTVPTRLSRATEALRAGGVRSAAVAGPVARRVGPVGSAVTGLGWTVLGAAVVAAIAAADLHWVEAAVLATALLLLFVLCCAFVLGRAQLEVAVSVEPRRVVAGEPAGGSVSVTNVSRARLLPVALEVPIGQSAARFELPSIARAATHRELFVLPTKRRGVIEVGPARTVRGDPLGLLRRQVAWTGVTELFVHPRTVPLEPVGSGLLRDLEGRVTNDVSMSDLAFHTLRDYQPGDDRRYIHWRSSAKVSTGARDGKFLVRQFLDTRRSHVTVVLDGDPASYDGEDQFETAVSVGASVAMRSLLDEMDTTVVAGRRVVDHAPPFTTLDVFSRAETDGTSLRAAAAEAVRVAPDTSIAVLVSGPHTSFTDLRRAAANFSVEVSVLGVTVDPTTTPGLRAAAGLTVLRLQHLTDLSALLAGAGV